MTTGRDRHHFWETTGSTKTFTHSLDPDPLRPHVPVDARVLDYGCGYGRLTAELAAVGYDRVYGADFSRALVARGLRQHPGLRLAPRAALPLPDGRQLRRGAALRRADLYPRRLHATGDRRGAGPARGE